MFKKLYTSLLLLVLAACAGNNPPKPPSGLYDFSVSVSNKQGQLLPQASVKVDDREQIANDFGWAYFQLRQNCYIVNISKEKYIPSGDMKVCIDRHTRMGFILDPVIPPAPPTVRLTMDNGKIFKYNSEPWRYKGVTAFGLMNRYSKGEDIQPFLDAFKGYNTLRVFYYVDWVGTGWGIPSDEAVHNFLNYVGERGWYVELVLLTGPKPLNEAQGIVNHIFTDFAAHTNLLVELVNEPGVHDKVDPSQLAVPNTPVIWSDGYTIEQHRGVYLTPHTARDSEWPRRAHDLLEYWTGGGPGALSDPAWKQPAVGDEPAKLEDVGGCNEADWEAYFGTSALLGGGATYHFESGKYGSMPTAAEATCAAAALRGLDAFPASAPLGPYQRIDENGASLRTYVVGDYMVRIRPTTPTPPVAGFNLIEGTTTLYKR